MVLLDFSLYYIIYGHLFLLQICEFLNLHPKNSILLNIAFDFNPKILSYHYIW